jgi:hypothetical protein
MARSLERADRRPTGSNTVTRINPNPKKPSPKLKARRKLARYENVASAIMESKKSVLFREQPTRRVGSKPDTNRATQPTELEQWWENVDGKARTSTTRCRPGGTSRRRSATSVLYFDVARPKSAKRRRPPIRRWPYVRAYTPLDVLDWRRRRQTARSIWIKLLEAVQSAPDDRTRAASRPIACASSTKRLEALRLQNREVHRPGRAQPRALPVVLSCSGSGGALLTDIGESRPRRSAQLHRPVQPDERDPGAAAQSDVQLHQPAARHGPDAMTVERRRR